jgi:hypothetical protein
VALEKVALKGGAGGRLGHSNMAHWAPTEVVKSSARKRRRRDGAAEVAGQLWETGSEDLDSVRNRRYRSRRFNEPT